MQSLKFTATLTLLILLIGGSTVHGQRAWSLEECIQYALDNNISIKQQQLGVDIAQENLSQSRANMFPSLNASASHTYNFGRTIDPFTNEFATKTVRSNNFNISTGVTLFGGFQILNSIRQNNLELQASNYDVEFMKNDIALAVASAYLQILFSIELVDIASNQLTISTQQVERTSRLVQAGTLARGSLLTMEAQAATDELQLVNAQNNLEIAYLNLIQLLDLEETSEEFSIVVPDISLTEDEHLYSPMHIYNNAVQTQPEVLASDIRISSAERGVDIARGGRSPMLSLRGSFGTGYSGASVELTDVPGETRIIPFMDQLDANLNRSAGLVLSIPIFNNYQVKSTIGRSRISLENARLNNQLVRNQLFKTIQQSYVDAQAALKRYDATQKNLDALEEAFRDTEQRFNVGMVATLEYNDALNRLNAARSELLQAKYEYVFRAQILEFYMGNPIRL